MASFWWIASANPPYNLPAVRGSRPATRSIGHRKLFYGLVMGLLGYTVVVKRRPIIDFARKLIDFARSKLVKK